MGQEASFQQQGKITFAREKAQKGKEKKAMRNDHKQAEINRDDNNAATVVHFAVHQPTADLARWKTRCGLPLVNAQRWVTVAGKTTCRNCLRAGAPS
jgi:hypothetical protein